MESFIINYSEFHKDLICFVELLAQRFVPQAPSALKDVVILPKVLTPDDADLVTGDVSSVKKKFRAVLDSLTNLSVFIRPHVQEQYRDWADHQIFKLNWFLNLAKINLDRFAVLEDYNVSRASAGGIGGSNSGVQTGVSYSNIRKLREMDSAMRARV